ncbi:MAG: DUF5343 domain-containing protein [Dehalococcoidales bacterium]|nr:DUF5343 domain-containing protein [Dehalococcoidales bacterium]
MVKESGRKLPPPYISYRTFQNFLERLQQGVPARIDQSYWSERLSFSNGYQLMSALRFMGLIDAKDAPTSRLRLLAQASGAQRAEAMKQVTSVAFSFVLQESFDSQSATYAQLEEVFSTFELTAGVRRKCIKFFVELASDAGIPLSSFITKRLRLARSSTGTKPTIKKRGTKPIGSARNGTGTKAVTKRSGTTPMRNLIVPLPIEKVPIEMSWDNTLLTKFPTFDPSWSNELKLGWLQVFDSLKFPTFVPTWSDEVKLKWFEAFDKLLNRKFPKGKL